MPRHRRAPTKNAAEAPAAIGDNSLSHEALAAFVDRIERLEEEKRALTEDVKEVYAEVKAAGMDAKTLRRIVRLRRQDPDVRREEAERLDLYLGALGMS